MTHAPKFWASKLPENLRRAFWGLIARSEGGFSENHLGLGGETAYCRVLTNHFGPKD